MGGERMSDSNSNRDGVVPGAVGTAEVAADGSTSVTKEGSAGWMSAAGKREHEKEKRLAERGDRILDALARLITRWGYGKTTVDDVAREAGGAKGTVSLRLPTKGAMRHALIER